MNAVLTIVVFASVLYGINAVPLSRQIREAKELMLGKFQLVSDSKAPEYKAYLTALNMSEPFQQIMMNLQIDVEITKEGNRYHYKVVTPLLTKDFSFEPGKTMEDTYVDGRKYSALFTFEGKNTVKHIMKFDSATSENTYVFTPEGMTANLKAKDKVIVRKYKRVDKLVNEQ